MKIDLFDFIDNLNLNERELLKLTRHIFLKLTFNTGKTKYNDICKDIESIIKILP